MDFPFFDLFLQWTLLHLFFKTLESRSTNFLVVRISIRKQSVSVKFEVPIIRWALKLSFSDSAPTLTLKVACLLEPFIRFKRAASYLPTQIIRFFKEIASTSRSTNLSTTWASSIICPLETFEWSLWCFFVLFRSSGGFYSSPDQALQMLVEAKRK